MTESNSIEDIFERVYEDCCCASSIAGSIPEHMRGLYQAGGGESFGLALEPGKKSTKRKADPLCAGTGIVYASRGEKLKETTAKSFLSIAHNGLFDAVEEYVQGEGAEAFRLLERHIARYADGLVDHMAESPDRFNIIMKDDGINWTVCMPEDISDKDRAARMRIKKDQTVAFNMFFNEMLNKCAQTNSRTDVLLFEKGYSPEEVSCFKMEFCKMLIRQLTRALKEHTVLMNYDVLEATAA